MIRAMIFGLDGTLVPTERLKALSCAQAAVELYSHNLADGFDFIATRDDLQRGKPSPEIYQLVSNELAVPPGESLVIEDSPSGARGALAARMWCIVVGTPLTRQAIHPSAWWMNAASSTIRPHSQPRWTR